MDFQFVEKGVTLELKEKGGEAFTQLYVGAGWDMAGAEKVDLDLVAACLSGGLLKAQTRLVYYNDRTEPGVQLSEDNRTGEGDGDDENLVIDLSKVEADVDSIAIGVIAYSAMDLARAENFHFRICKGDKAEDPQVFDVKTDNAATGDTVLHAATLRRTDAGWTIENVSSFSKHGNGLAALKGFAGLFSQPAAPAAAA